MVVEVTHGISYRKFSRQGVKVQCICGWQTSLFETLSLAEIAFNGHISGPMEHQFTWSAGQGHCVCGWHSGRSNPSAAWQQFGAHQGVPSDPPVDREPVEEPKELDPDEPGAVPALMLALELQARSHAESAAITSALLASKDERLAELEATLTEIQVAVPRLFSGGFMPTENAILRAVRSPSRHNIEQRIKEIRARQEGNREAGNASPSCCEKGCYRHRCVVEGRVCCSECPTERARQEGNS